MSDPEVQRNKTGGVVARSSRNDYATTLEPTIRELAPFPASYDVTATQPTNFSEFTYTEFLSGAYIHTQSLDINTRIMDLASKQDCAEDHVARIMEAIGDKYTLDTEIPEKYQGLDHVMFMPGHNMFDIVSMDNVKRAFSDNKRLMLKPHPLTHPDAILELARNLGADRIIPYKLSGNYFFRNAGHIYSTTANEFCVLGFMYKKAVYNMSTFLLEPWGAYYSMARVLFSCEDPYKAMNNMIGCEWSGLVFKDIGNEDHRLRCFFAKALALREHYSPLFGKMPPPMKSNGVK